MGQNIRRGYGYYKEEKNTSGAESTQVQSSWQNELSWLVCVKRGSLLQLAGPRNARELNSDEGLLPLLSCRLIQKQRCLDCKWAEGLENHWALRLHLLSPLETVHAQGIVLKVLTCPKKINIGGTPPCIHVLTHVTLQFLPPKAECTFLTPDFGCRHLTWLGQLNVSRYNVIHLAARNVELKENI